MDPTQTAPAATPEPTTAPSAEPEVTQNVNAEDDSPPVDWASLASGDDDTGDTSAAPAAGEPAQQAQGEQTTPPPSVTGTEGAQTSAPPAQPVAAPSAPPAATPPETTTPPAATEVKPPAKTAEEIAAEETKLLEGLEKAYALPETMAAQLQTEPEVVLPKLAAMMHKAIVQDLTQRLTGYIPQAVRHVQTLDSAEQSARKAFYEANPDLLEHEEVVLRTGAMFRQMNPKATPEESIKRIGELVRVGLGKPLQSAGTPAATPPAPAARTMPFAPAGSTASRAPAPANSNPWAAIADELLAEDRG